MFRKIGHIFLLIAFICAMGGHWVVLQSIAWTTMLANNLQTCSVTEAVQRTFDPTRPCCLCKQISDGKQDEQKSDFSVEGKKLEFPFESHRFVFVPPSFYWEAATLPITGTSRSYSPPVPPPRPFRS